jgi:Leucine-rich repeat (LRR) protein
MACDSCNVENILISSLKRKGTDMRHLIAFTAILLSALLLLNGCRRKEPAQIDNAAIVRKAIADKLNKKPEELTTEDYEKTTVLDLSGTQVSDLTPIKELTRLQKLDISDTKVSDLTPLKGLTSLHKLNLGGTTVSDLTPLKELKGLEDLRLSDTSVSDLTPLKELNKLQVLFLDGTKVPDEQVSELKKALPELKIIR